MYSQGIEIGYDNDGLVNALSEHIDWKWGSPTCIKRIFSDGMVGAVSTESKRRMKQNIDVFSRICCILLRADQL